MVSIHAPRGTNLVVSVACLVFPMNQQIVILHISLFFEISKVETEFARARVCVQAARRRHRRMEYVMRYELQPVHTVELVERTEN